MANTLGGAKPPGGGGSGPGDFILCPAGAQLVVCCDVVDVGWVKVPGWRGGPAKNLYKTRLRFLSEHKLKDGRPYLVQRQFTKSAHPNATLRKFLESWRGRPFDSDTQAENFDIDKLIGVNAYITVAHLRKPKGVFAEVMSVMPTPRGMSKLTVPTEYIRMKDRPDTARRQPGEEEGEAPPDWVNNDELDQSAPDNDFPE